MFAAKDEMLKITWDSLDVVVGGADEREQALEWLLLENANALKIKDRIKLFAVQTHA